MKTIKVAEGVHFELKRYAANNPKDKMEDIAGLSIMVYLKAHGHKFMSPFKLKSKNK